MKPDAAERYSRCPAGSVGDLSILRRPLLGLLCGTRVPPDLALPTFDFVAAHARRGETFIGGFQGPLERECLDLIMTLEGSAVVAMGRSLTGWTLPDHWSAAALAGRLLVISEFTDPRERRPTLSLALRRNAAVAHRCRRLFIPVAHPGGRTLRVAKAAIATGVEVRCLPHPANRDLLLLGATAVSFPVGEAGTIADLPD